MRAGQSSGGERDLRTREASWRGSVERSMSASCCFNQSILSHSICVSPSCSPSSIQNTSHQHRQILFFAQYPSFVLDPIFHTIIFFPSNESSLRDVTYTTELQAAVTAFRNSSLLLDVKVSESATGGLDNADLVGLCWVADILLVVVVGVAENRIILRGAPAVGESVLRKGSAFQHK